LRNLDITETGWPDRFWLLLSLACMWTAQALFVLGFNIPGVMFLVAGVAAILMTRRAPEAGPVSAYAILAGAAVFFALALVLRTWKLDSIPPLWWDEAVEAYDAGSLADGLPLEPLVGINYHRSPLWLAMLAATGKVFGLSLTGFRLVSALAGSALVALVFVSGARLYGVAAGALAATWLAFHPWPLNLSRLLMANILVPLAGVAIVLAAAAKSLPLPWRAVITGGIAGISLYGYAAALHLPWLAALAVWLFAPRGTPAVRRLGWAAVALAIAAVASAPVKLLMPGFWGKAASVSVLFSPSMLAGNLADAFPLFHAAGDMDMRHQYPSGAPVFVPWLAPFFSLGLALTIRNAARPAYGLLLGWLALGLLPGLASEAGGRNLFRMAGALPAVALLCAVGGTTAAGIMGARAGRVILVLLWASFGVAAVRDYFVDFPSSRATPVWFRTFDRDAALDLKGMAVRNPLLLCRALPLSQYPVERLLLRAEMRSGRISDSGTDCGRLVPLRIYRDPYGQAQAVLLASADPASVPKGAPLKVEYRTVMDIGLEGDGLLAAGRTEDSLRVYRRWTLVLPDSPTLAERLGFAALRTREYPEARRAFERAIALGSHMPAVYDGLAAACYRGGDLAGAEKSLKEGLRYAPDDGVLAGDLRQVIRDRDALRRDRDSRANVQGKKP
jgi:tetratricopeptide (TPR) repeat protein